MYNISILNLNYLAIADQKSGKTFYGCDQEWFADGWQRLSGCGTSVAANIILYLHKKNHAEEWISNSSDKDEIAFFMDEIWKHVTPTSHGIHTTKMFYEPLLSYVISKGLNYRYKFMNLPASKINRPELAETVNFLKEALSRDVPVAFLNLCSGAETNLEQWHWVTIISLEYISEEKQAFIYILDEGVIKKIDFTLWYNTARREAGFVYFTET